MRRHNASEMDCTLCRLRGSLQSGVHDLRVVTRSYSLSQLSLLKTHETLVPSVGRFQSADRLNKINLTLSMPGERWAPEIQALSELLAVLDTIKQLEQHQMTLSKFSHEAQV